MANRLGLAVALAAFAVHAVMAADGTSWMDPGELAAAGFHLGGSHPPGHPAHSLLVKLASLIPVGEVAFRAALASAACLAAAVAAVHALARELVPRQEVGAVVAAALVAVAPAALVNATRAEVYAPTAALLAAAALAALRMIRRGDLRWGAAAGGLCGLAAAFHPLIAAAFAAPLAGWMVAAARGKRARLAILAGALALLGLCVYLLLPVRAAAGTLLVWQHPDSPAGLVDALTAPGYRANFGASGIAGRAVGLWLLAGEGMALGLLLAGLVGLAFGAATRLRGAGMLAACAVATVLAAAAQQRLNPDMRGYVLPAVAMLGVGAAIAIEAAVRALPAVHGVAASIAVALPVAALGLAAGSAPERERSDDVMALIDDTLGRMPPGPGVFFANGDHLLFPARYERHVAGLRPDIAIASANLVRDRWFAEQLDRLVPALHVPFVDDRIAGEMATRLAVINLRAGRPVGGDQPAFALLDPALARPNGRGYVYGLERATTPPGSAIELPPPYRGEIGRRVAGRVGLLRGEYEALGGRLADAARAAGIADRFGDALAVVPDDAAHPPLYRYLPEPRGVLLWEPWMSDVLGDDLAWRAGLAAPALAPGAPVQRLLHAQWRGLLEGKVTAGDGSVGRFGVPEEAATTLMLIGVGRAELAEAHLRGFLRRRGDDPDALAILASIRLNADDVAEAESLFRRSLVRAPDNAETLARLGVVLARQGKLAEARTMWERALAIEPERQDVRAWLERAK